MTERLEGDIPPTELEGDIPTPEGYVSDTSDKIPSASDPPLGDKAATRKQAVEDKKKKQLLFIAQCTLHDVLVDLTAPKLFKGSTKTTALQSIKGACVNQLGFPVIRQFCIINKIAGWRGKSKVEMCDMIVERKRHANMDQVMYPKNPSMAPTQPVTT
jgi:hypothetical protein